MKRANQNRIVKPPVWAETLLRALLAQRSRDAIVGDLLEEYRESVLPSVGTVHAQVWYIRQVLSFLDVPALVKIVGNIPVPLWGTAAALFFYVLLIAVPNETGLPVSTVLFLFTGIVLTVSGATAIRTLKQGWSLLRISFLGFICFAVTTTVVANAEVFRPALIMATFLVIVTATGFRGARSTGQARSGIAVAVGIGMAAAALMVVTVSVLHLPHPPLVAAPTLPGMAAISGTIGAFFGKRFGGSPAVPVSPLISS